MDKNLAAKFILIVVLVVVAVWTLYPPSKTLKPGIDLAGGTSLIYEIDTHGLAEFEKRDLAQRMITVLRRRIDPANIQNLIWRPQGSSRFEIQMPLASAESRTKRENFEKAASGVLAGNISIATIMRSLEKPAEERTADFEEFARDNPVRLTILNNLATIYDQRRQLQAERDNLAAQLKSSEDIISATGINLERVKVDAGRWLDLSDEQLRKALIDLLSSEDNIELVVRHVKTYAQWAKVVGELTEPEFGKNAQYNGATKALDKLNLTEEQINSVLAMPQKSERRRATIEELKAEFPHRSNQIQQTVAAFDEYQPFQGRLDDPRDLQRMLKGAGILEFRILPTIGHPEVDQEQMISYAETLKTKGPKYASDKNYIWCEVENIDEWKRNDVVIAPFGNKYYVLASNRPNEAMLHGTTGRDWSLKNSYPQTDKEGRRAIGFTLDEKGGKLFANVTGKNLERPLCILLDGIAISAPTVQSRISTSGIITGSFTQTEVIDMVNKLNAGSLPARLIEQPISVKTIGPSIGADNRNQGIRAGIIGLIGVVLCMATYYTLSGAIADTALLMNLLFTLAIMALLRATFTLPGIAGTILTIGMSIDANVLIFERIREEQLRGSSMRMAIKNGYERAFTAIFDSNLTTVLTAVILYWVASEEIKGFAIVLIFGLASSMFTALFVTRCVFDYLVAKRFIKERLVMMHLIRTPKINWMASRPLFFAFSAIFAVGGLAVFFTRDNTKNNKYDIEFTGGTSIQINLKDGVNLTRRNVEDIIHKAGAESGSPALATANVYSIGESGRQYEITTTETNRTITNIFFPNQTPQTVESVTMAIKKAQNQLHNQLSNLVVTGGGSASVSFAVTTGQLNKSLVKDVLKTAFPDAEISEPQTDEVVNKTVLAAFADKLQIQQNLNPKIVSAENITEQLIDSYPELSEFLGGVKITCEIERAASAGELDQRMRDLRFKPDMRNLDWYSYKIVGLDLMPLDPNRVVNSFVYVSAEPEAGYRQLTETEWAQFVENETTKVTAAAQLETSLPRVTQFSPSVGNEAKTRALIAIVLSLFALLIYIWVRFGDLRYGMGAVITLGHDICITLGAVAGCTYIANTFIGEKLLIGDFKIDMVMIGAFLTLLGYSLNDSIVIYDRIRENCHKRPLSPQLITDSINQTLSRTLLTGCTTLLVVFVMYIFGGKGLRGFNFAMLFGIIIGTYSSIAISAPVLLFRTKPKDQIVKHK